MSEEDAFIQEIRANPHEEMPRLIFADFLEEAGDPRGEFIRVQCELANREPGDPERVTLNARERELVDGHADDWLAPLRALGVEGISARCFQRGLIERVRIPASNFLANGEELCAIAPAVFCVELKRPQDALPQLAKAEFPAQVTELDLSANRLDAEAMSALNLASWTWQIEHLNLRFNQLADDGVQELVQGIWPRLKRLDLTANRIGPEGARTLANWQVLEQLTSLSLNVNAIGSIGAEVLAASQYASNLQDLELASNGMTPRGARALAQAQPLRHLKRLNLRGNRIGLDGRLALAESTTLALDLIDLRNNGVESVDE